MLTSLAITLNKVATGPRDVPYYPLDGGGIIHAKGLIVAGFSPPLTLPQLSSYPPEQTHQWTHPIQDTHQILNQISILNCTWALNNYG